VMRIVGGRGGRDISCLKHEGNGHVDKTVMMVLSPSVCCRLRDIVSRKTKIECERACA
jgi:hypothetical protein